MIQLCPLAHAKRCSLSVFKVRTRFFSSGFHFDDDDKNFSKIRKEFFQNVHNMKELHEFYGTMVFLYGEPKAKKYFRRIQEDAAFIVEKLSPLVPKPLD